MPGLLTGNLLFGAGRIRLDENPTKTEQRLSDNCINFGAASAFLSVDLKCDRHGYALRSSWESCTLGRRGRTRTLVILS